MILVTYKIQYKKHEYNEHSWFFTGTKSDYDKGIIKDKVLIEEVYGEAEQEKEKTNKYFVRDWNTFIQVKAVQDITQQELDGLNKFGIIYI